MTKSLLAGFLVTLLIPLLWLAALHASIYSNALLLLLWGSPLLAAAVGAFLAPRKKFAVGLVMAVPATLFFGGYNMIAENLGMEGDFTGVEGALYLAGMMFFPSICLAAAGAAAGKLMSRWKIDRSTI